MTQAPATPELVERLRDLTRFMTGTPRSRAMLDAAAALEAQQARIAELEGLFADVNALCTEINKRWEAAQALADRYEKALAYIAENDRSYLVAPTPGAKGYPGHYGHVARQALSSSQGRHEGGEDGLPELPGVNAVPLPASPDGPSPLDAVRRAIKWALDHDLKHRDTSRDPKTNGYAYAEVPDWALRQWLHRVEASISGVEIYGSAKPGDREGHGTERPQASPQPRDEPLPSPDNTNPKAGAPEHG